MTAVVAQTRAAARKPFRATGSRGARRHRVQPVNSNPSAPTHSSAATLTSTSATNRSGTQVSRRGQGAPGSPDTGVGMKATSRNSMPARLSSASSPPGRPWMAMSASDAPTSVPTSTLRTGR